MNEFNYFLIALIFVFSFTKGAFELLGFSETILQLSIEFLIFILFFHSLLFVVKRRRLEGPGLYVNFFLFAMILISFLLSNVSTLQLILFMRKFGVYYLFFYALFNLNISSICKDKLFELIIFLFLIQIPAAFIKLLILGTQEKVVGTMSVQEGSLASIMPLMAISYLIANYLEFKNIKYIVLIFLFIAIGLISNKMGILFYIMILFFTLSFLYSYKYSNTLINIIFIRNLFSVLIFVTFIFMAFVSLNPRANPEHKVGGSIDIEFLVNYIDDYQNLDLKDSRVEGDGRFEAPGVALDRLEKKGFLNVLLGFGPGDIVQSSYIRYKNPLLEKYNIGYGGRLGLVWVLMQIGLIGVMLFLLFHLLLFKKIWNVYKGNSTDNRFRALVLAILGFSMIYFLDFFTYSASMIQNSGLAITYFFAIYYILSSREDKVILRGQKNEK